MTRIQVLTCLTAAVFLAPDALAGILTGARQQQVQQEFAAADAEQ